MAFRLTPKEDSFYDLFATSAAHLVSGARELTNLLASDTPEARSEVVQRMRDLEHQADEATHQIISRVNSSFITPFDREDIHALTEQIDDVVDEIQGVSDLLVLHRISEPLPEMKEIADIIVQAAAATVTLVAKLQNPRQVQGELEEVDRLESAADAVYRRTVANLFAGGYEAREVLRWKDIVEAMEAAMNGIEDVSNIVEAIVLKHA